MQSVHLDGDRLLVCQKRLVSVYSSTASTPGVSTGLPFCHLVHRVTLDHVAQWAGKPTTSSALQMFHFMKYDAKLGVMALATTDAVLVWGQQKSVFDMGDK